MVESQFMLHWQPCPHPRVLFRIPKSRILVVLKRDLLVVVCTDIGFGRDRDSGILLLKSSVLALERLEDERSFETAPAVEGT